MVGNWVVQLIWIYTLFYFFPIGCDWYASCYFSKTDKQYNLIIYSIITLVYMFFIPTIITMCQKSCRRYYRKLERLKESGTLIRSGLALSYWFVVLQSLKKNTHLTNVLSGKHRTFEVNIWTKMPTPWLKLVWKIWNNVKNFLLMYIFSSKPSQQE